MTDNKDIPIEKWEGMSDSTKNWWAKRLAKKTYQEIIDGNAKGGKNSKGVKKRSGFAVNRELAKEMGEKRAKEFWG